MATVAPLTPQYFRNQVGDVSVYGTTNGNVSVGDTCALFSDVVPLVSAKGINFRFNLSDVTKIGIALFKIYRRNELILTIYDQIGDLLNPLYIPVDVEPNESISVVFDNTNATSSNLAAACWIEFVNK